MSWVLTGAACGALASGAVTVAIFAETEPFINEDGEEEYTLSGYLLLATAYVIKWPLKKLFELIRPRKTQTYTHKEVEVKETETENDFELII